LNKWITKHHLNKHSQSLIRSAPTCVIQARQIHKNLIR